MDNLHMLTRLCAAVLVSAISAGTASSSNAAILENNSQNTVKEQKDVTVTAPNVIKYSSTEGGYVRSIMDGSPVRATVESADSVLVGSEAIPEEGYEFVCWYDEEGKFVSFMPELIAKQDSEIKAYKAHFRKIIQPVVDPALTTFPAAVAGVNRPVSEEKKEEVKESTKEESAVGAVEIDEPVEAKDESAITEKQETSFIADQELVVESSEVGEDPAAEPVIEEVQEPEISSEESSEKE